MNKASYTPPRISRRCLKLLPAAALVAAGIAPQAFAQSTEGCNGLPLIPAYFGWPAYSCVGIGGLPESTLIVSGGSFFGAIAIHRGDSWQNACTDCTLRIEGGEITGRAIGSCKPDVPGSVIISGGTVNKVFGAGAGDYNCDVGQYNSANNKITIEGGTVTDIFGARNRTNNTITLAGGTVLGSVYGTGLDSTPNGKKFSDAVTGNTLVVQTKDFEAGGEVMNFENLAFTLPDGIKDADTLLRVGGMASFPFPTDGFKVLLNFNMKPRNSFKEYPMLNSDGEEITSDLPIKVSIAFAEGSQPQLQEGDAITLIDAAGGLHINVADESKVITAGDYTFMVRVDPEDANKLTATVTDIARRVRAAQAEGGTLTCTPDVVHKGETVECTAEAEDGYAFSDATIAPESAASITCAEDACTLTNITDDITVTATFAPVIIDTGDTGGDSGNTGGDTGGDTGSGAGDTGAGGDSGANNDGRHRRHHHSVPAMGEAGLLLAGIALAGAAAPALRRRARKVRKQD